MRIRLFLLTCLVAAVAFAADVTGKWTYEMPGRGGQTQQGSINLKVDGSTVTGTVSGPRGETDISNGKVDGDTVTFSVVREYQGNSMKMNYTGKISGDTIQFKIEREGGGGQGRAREFTAKRAN
jgi:autotransporter translocation and assembly factor TamB